MGVTHAAVVVVPDDGASPVGSDEWNAGHVVGDGSFAAAKIAFAATDKVLGRSTAGAGNGEEIAATAAGRAILAGADAVAQRATLGLGAAALLPSPYLPYRTGGAFYYGTWTGAVTTGALVQSTMYCAPFFVPVTTTFTKIGVTAIGVASSSVRLGIYSDTGGVPNALVLDAGTVATTGTAFVTITINQSLTPGWYWLAAAVQGAAGNLYTNQSGFFANAALPVATPGSSFIAGGYSVTGVTGALPSPWGATKTETGKCPVVWLAPQ